MIGKTLLHFRITAKLGEGGMGEVYRAEDTKLGREVAIKVLPEGFSDEPERMARFEREAKVLASLNHNNIATLHGFEAEGQAQFLVMELVEGETLAERIKRGAIPVGEALSLFLQIAEGLESAHEKGVIHRDLKPANIKVTDDGQVKILDFGLAKAMAPEVDTSDPALSQSPTLTLAATQRGEILGTAAYMSPEQARGKPIDKRTDVWAFGVCLYEALVGQRLFQGEDAMETVGAVLRDTPSWDPLPPSLPRRLRELLERCLRKDPRQRLRDIGDAVIEIEEALATPEGEETPGAVVTEKRSPVPLALATLAVGSVIAGIAAWTLKPDPPGPVVRAVVSAFPSQQVSTSSAGADLTITPDGERIVYSVQNDDGTRGLYVRPVDRLQGAPLGGLQGLQRVGSPFVSTDGSLVGFEDNETLMKISIRGGPPVTLCSLPTPGFLRGASWGETGTIVFGLTGSRGLFRVPAAGGEPEFLTTPDLEKGETWHRWPEYLPDDSAVLFTIAKGQELEIAVLSLDTGEIQTLVPEGSHPHYALSGHLVYGIDGTLRAVPFDLDRLEVTGDPVPVLEGVLTKPGGAVAMAFSRGGRLVYVSGDAEEGPSRTLAWVDREGREEPIMAPPRAYVHARISPDGKKVALDLQDTETDIWIWDFSVELLTRLTFSAGADRYSIWTPDGESILFGSARAGSQGMYLKAASGAGTDERLTDELGRQYPNSISPDGTQLVYRQEGDTEGSPDLFLLSLEGELRGEPLLASEFAESNGEISSDGRWLAYMSDESGNYEVYVRPFPNVGDGQWQISTSGGGSPLWSRDGQELFYRSSGRVWAVPVETDEDFRYGTPKLLFARTFFSQFAGRNYDVSRDGEHFLMITSDVASEEGSQPDVVLVEGWFEELKRVFAASEN